MLAQFKKSTIVHVLWAISYFTSGLIINIGQCLSYLLIKPFSKKLFRQVMYYLCYSFFCQLVFMSDWWSNTKLYTYMDPEDRKKYSGKEHVLLIMNHCYEIDWLLGWVHCDKIGVLGNCKAYAKKVLKYIPTVGWSWSFAEFVFLERSFDKDKENIARQLKELVDYPSPMWILLNAEGTRFTKTKHEASVKFARERGMYELKHHLIPRTKGFTTSLPHLRGGKVAIYDIQLAIEENPHAQPTISSLLHGKGVTGHLLVRRIPLDRVPEDEEGAAKFLQNLFIEKDKLQDSFQKHGTFFHESTGLEKLEPELAKPRLSTLLNTVGWAIATLIPMMYYLAQLLLSGQLISFSIGAVILLGFYFLMQKSIGMSEISKASSFGATPTTPTKPIN